ncbi:MAG: TolC family protein [Prevotella sp.]|nr:TolC family protein [Prevotella sp.]
MKNNNNRYLCIMMLMGCMLATVTATAQKIMTLKECIAAARTGNTRAKDAQNDILAAKQQQAYARTKYFPMLNASGFHFRSTDYIFKATLIDDEDVELLGEMIDDPELAEYISEIGFIKKGTAANVTMIEPLYTGGRIHNYNKLADLQVKARYLLQDVADDEIVMSTEFLYYKIFELHETDKTLDAVEKELANIHQDAVNIYENGIVNKNDVLSVELAQDQLSALRIKTTNARNLLRRALAKYIGQADEDIDVDTTLTAEVVEPRLLKIDSQTALENRSETQLLDIWVDKSVLERKIAKANMLPVFGVGASYGYTRYLDNGQTKGVGFVAVQMPLSAFWSERHEYKRKKIEEQKAQDFRKDKLELLSLQMQDAYDNLESTYQQTLIAEKSIVRAEENLRINRESYRNGLTTMTVLLDAQRQQQQAYTQRTAALSEYLQAKTRYLILTGRRNDK